MVENLKWRGPARLGSAEHGMARLGEARVRFEQKGATAMGLFIGGQSTTLEVDALKAAIKVEPGKSVSHEDVAKAAGVDVSSNRFKTVTHRWRKIIERDTGVRTESRDGVFHFMTADEALDRGKTDMHRIGRATGKLHVRVGSIDTKALTGERKEQHLLLTRETAALLDSARRSAKAIQGPKPVRPSNLRLAN